MIYRDDPHLGDIDCTEVTPIIDHPLFQLLRLRRQLGLSFLIFPRAQHTRFDHSIGAYERTRQRMRIWLNKGVVDRQTARDIEIFGLVHDIGHGPYSHVVEPVTNINHDERGANILKELEPAIKKCRGNFERIQNLFNHTDPLFGAVHDKNLGTEKFDYLERDSAVTDSGRPQLRDLPWKVTFKDGELVVPYKDDLLDAALHIQEFYVDMYKNVYLRPASAVLHRWIQKLIFTLMKDDELTEDSLWSMVDGDLDAAILNSRQDWVAESMRKIRSREWPRVAISIKPTQFPEDDVIEKGHRLQSVFSVSMRRLKKLTKYFNRNPRRLADAEEDIEKNFNLPEHSVIIIPLAETQRFKTQQIRVYKEGCSITNLSRWRPKGVDRLREIADSYVCLRIATDTGHREQLAKTDIAKRIVQYLFNKIA